MTAHSNDQPRTSGSHPSARTPLKPGDIDAVDLRTSTQLHLFDDGNVEHTPVYTYAHKIAHVRITILLV